MKIISVDFLFFFFISFFSPKDLIPHGNHLSHFGLFFVVEWEPAHFTAVLTPKKQMPNVDEMGSKMQKTG